MTRGMRATLARIKALDMSHRKIPKSLSVGVGKCLWVGVSLEGQGDEEKGIVGKH